MKFHIYWEVDDKCQYIHFTSKCDQEVISHFMCQLVEIDEVMTLHDPNYG